MSSNFILSFLIIVIIAGCSFFAKNSTGRDASSINSVCEMYLDSCFQREIYKNVTEKPEFPGGSSELYKYVAQQLKYTEEEFGLNDGRLLIQIVVEKDGEVNQFRLKEACSTEANSIEKRVAEILTKGPKWKPGRCDQEDVATLFEFRLMI